jgi:hypothetical protein
MILKPTSSGQSPWVSSVPIDYNESFFSEADRETYFIKMRGCPAADGVIKMIIQNQNALLTFQVHTGPLNKNFEVVLATEEHPTSTHTEDEFTVRWYIGVAPPAGMDSTNYKLQIAGHIGEEPIQYCLRWIQLSSGDSEPNKYGGAKVSGHGSYYSIYNG